MTAPKQKDTLDWVLIVLRIVHLVCVAVVVVLVVKHLQTRPNEALALIVGLMLVNMLWDEFGNQYCMGCGKRLPCDLHQPTP